MSYPVTESRPRERPAPRSYRHHRNGSIKTPVFAGAQLIASGHPCDLHSPRSTLSYLEVEFDVLGNAGGGIVGNHPHPIDYDRAGHPGLTIVFNRHASRDNLRVRKYLVQLIDRTCRNPCTIEPFEEIVPAPFRGDLFERYDQIHAVADPLWIIAEPLIFVQCHVQYTTKRSKLAIVPDCDDQISITGRERLIGYQISVAIAYPAWHYSRGHPVERLITHDADLGI